MIRKLHDRLSDLCRDERGLTTVEYAIVLCLIAALAVGAWNSFGGHIKTNLEGADKKIDAPLKAASSNGG